MTLFKYSMKKAIKYILILLSIVIMLLCGSGNTLLVHAESVDITTSSVRDDLESMDEDKLSYLSDEDFIFIAMSQYYDKEENLRTYLYVNFPYGQIVFDDYHAYVNISTSIMDENYNITEDFELYSIKYVNHEETWYKLEVLNLPNLEETTRRYYIQDFRTYMNSLENTSSLDDYMSCDEVSKVYIFNGVSNNTIKVFRQEMETITITDKEVAFWCFGDDEDILFWESEEGSTLDGLLSYGNTYSDVWYIFFNTDKPMEDLMEIEVTYQQYDYCIGIYDGTLKMKDIPNEEDYNAFINDLPLGYQSSRYDDVFYFNKHEQINKTITPGKEKVSSNNSNWYGKHFYEYETLDNIMDMKKYQEEDYEHFIFTDYANKYNWGVKFLTTERKVTEVNNSGMPILEQGSGVSNTAILRLKYETNGIVHNAYAVDVPTDDFVGNDSQVNTGIDTKQISEWFEKILMLIGILILVVIIGYFSPIFSVIFNLLIKCITWSFKGILLIISAPFKLIGNLFKPKKRK